jgi:tRNA/rRNA methyltransferase
MRGKVALVLGGEKRGLSDAELELCHDVVAIPTPGPQPSMNLSHAAGILMYLCSRKNVMSAAVGPVGATGELLRRLERKMDEALTACEFLNPQAKARTLHELSRTLVQGHLSEREAEMWIAAFEHVRRVTSAVASR